LFVSDDAGSVGSGGGSDKTKEIIKVIGITVGIVIFLSGLTVYFVWKRKGLQAIRNGKTQQKGIENLSSVREMSVK
jgi:flagellar basal body-associated protein FliL